MAGVHGQGRKFNVDDALDKAMDVFWRNGYEGTTIAKLTKAMGITASSLYAAFKDKKNLFDRVVEHYLNTEGRFINVAFAEEDHALPLIRRILFEAADKYADKSGPGGCLIVSAATCVTDANRDVEKKIRKTSNFEYQAHPRNSACRRRRGLDCPLCKYEKHSRIRWNHPAGYGAAW